MKPTQDSLGRVRKTFQFQRRNFSVSKFGTANRTEIKQFVFNTNLTLRCPREFGKDGHPKGEYASTHRPASCLATVHARLIADRKTEVNRLRDRGARWAAREIGNRGNT